MTSRSGLLILAISGATFLMSGFAAVRAETALPANATTDLENGAQAIDEKRYEDAVAAFSRALDSNALDDLGQALAHHHRGIAQQRLGRYLPAIADYGYAIHSGKLPDTVLARTYYNRAIAYGEVNDPSAAESDYGKCIEVTPGFAAAYHNRANLERRRGAHAESIRDYTAAIARLSPNDQKQSLYGRALAREQSSDVDGARRDLELALKIDPAYHLARTKLADLDKLDMQKTASVESPRVLSGKTDEPKSEVIRVASTGGWETTAIRFENGTPIHLPPSASPQPKQMRAEPMKVASLSPSVQTRAEAPDQLGLKPSQDATTDKAALRLNDKYRLQLGAFRSEDVAMGQWQTLLGKAPDSLTGREPKVERADLGEKGIYYRLQTIGFGSASEARSLCSTLKAQKLDCIVVIR